MDWKLFRSLIYNITADRLNREMIGYSTEMAFNPITRKDFLPFAEATQDFTLLNSDRNDAVPPFFIYKLIFPMIKNLWSHKNLELNLLRTIYSGQELIWHKTIKIGDELKIRIQINDIYDVPVGELIEVSGKGLIDDKLVFESMTTFIVKGKRKISKTKSTNKHSVSEKFRLHIQTEDGQQLRFAKASGDYNFIHTSNILAKIAGLPRTIMHGVCVLSMSCSSLIEHVLQNETIKSLKTH